MINHSAKIQKTRVVPLRWIGNFLGGCASNHLLKCVNMDEDEEYGWRYKYHAKMWKYLNKPYKWWGTYYTIDMSTSGWDDYDEFGKAYWDKDKP